MSQIKGPLNYELDFDNDSFVFYDQEGDDVAALVVMKDYNRLLKRVARLEGAIREALVGLDPDADRMGEGMRHRCHRELAEALKEST